MLRKLKRVPYDKDSFEGSNVPYDNIEAIINKYIGITNEVEDLGNNQVIDGQLSLFDNEQELTLSKKF